MAKWGEGDPRWIVEERPDATNVNNWHWTEKNATNWSKDKLKELLTGFVIEDSDVFGEILSLTSMEGEASANNRKAKLIFFYEWVIKGEWSGKMKTGDKKFKGKFEIPNLSEENEPDEVVVNITVDKNSDDAYKVKEMMRKVGTPLIQLQLAKYIKLLKEEYSHNVILPTKDKKQNAPAKDIVVNPKNEINKVVSSSEKKKDVGVKISTKTLQYKAEFKCAVPDLYRVFVDKEMVQAFTGSPAVYEVEKGGKFSLMNGFVEGTFVDIVPDTKIEQRWRLKSWPDAHFSDVTMEFKEEDGNTYLKLTQKGVPSGEYEKTMEGWKVNYFSRIKQVFGFGSLIF